MKIRPMTEETKKSIMDSFVYIPETGEFFHKVAKRGGRVKPMSKVRAKPGNKGYLQIGHGGVVYLAHRLAWLLMTGDWPDLQVDHIDHVRSNNVFSNLRLVDARGNKMNESLRKDNKSGRTGVFWCGARKRWVAFYFENGKLLTVGQFHDKDDAIMARIEANKTAGFHENHGKPKKMESA